MRFQLQRCTVRTILALLAFVLLSGCTQPVTNDISGSPVALDPSSISSTSDSTVPSEQNEEPVKSDGAVAPSGVDFGVEQESLDTPLKAYVLMGEQYLMLDRATDALAGDCMEKQGYRIDLPDRQIDPIWYMTYRRYAPVTDGVTAARWGYHLPADNSRAAEEPSWTEEESEAFLQCTLQAREELGRGLDRLVDGGANRPELVDDLYFDDTPAEDPGVVQAQREWSECMAKQGYGGLDDTLSDRAKLAPSVAGAAPDQAEIDMALTDVQCQVETRVIEIWNEAEVTYQNMMIDRQAEAFAELKQQRETLLKRVAEVLQ